MSRRTRFSTARVCVATLLSLCAGLSFASPGETPGEALARLLNASYAHVTDHCTDTEGLTKGPYWCSGVILRGVSDGNYNPWEPSPSAIARGSVSYSWLRRDINIRALWGETGVINLPPGADPDLWPEFGTVPRPYGVKCVYTFDAYTSRMPRDAGGCGFEQPAGQSRHRHARNPFSWGSCDQQLGISTAAQWWTHFVDNGSEYYKQCSWSADYPGGWTAMIEARATFYPSTILWNELLIAPFRNERELSFVAAYFYDSSIATSMEIAQTFQRKTIAAGRYVPILRLDFSLPDGEPFSYRESDQIARRYR